MTGIEIIAQTKLEGLSAWIAYAIGLAVFTLLVLSNAVRRRRHGLHVNVAGRIALPLVGGALFGAVIVAIPNAHQGIPLVVLIFALLLGVGGYILGETQFGLYLYAIGNNDEAARRAGIDVPRIKMAAFAIAAASLRSLASSARRAPWASASSPAAALAAAHSCSNRSRLRSSAASACSGVAAPSTLRYSVRSS